MKAQIPKVKIGIVGYGFVGKATDSGFCRNVEKFIVDPKINTTIDDRTYISLEVTVLPSSLALSIFLWVGCSVFSCALF